MLYILIKIITRLAIRTFFNSIVVKNRKSLPHNAPVIFAANHPNTMMDALIIGHSCGRDLYYLAKSTVFKNALSSWLLTKLRIIPIFRKQDVLTETAQNEDTFIKCFEILEQGKAILIFPEGISLGDRLLHRIKTGAARIGFGTEARNEFNLNVQIIPVGLNYADLIKFRSDVYLRFGKPIFLSDYREVYKEDSHKAVSLVTNQIELALSKLTTNLKNQEMEEIVTALETIYKHELAVDFGMEIKDKHNDFSVTKGLINAVEWFTKHQPRRVEELRNKLAHYVRNLERLHLKDEFLAPKQAGIKTWKRMQALLFIVFGFPLFLYGIINNLIPYKIPRWFVNRFVESKSEWASTKMLTGLLVFLVYYSFLITGVALWTGSVLWTILYALTLAPSGNFVLDYIRQVRKYRQHLRFITIFYHKRMLIYNLIQQRMRIIQTLDEAKKEYLDAVGLDLSAIKQ